MKKWKARLCSIAAILSLCLGLTGCGIDSTASATEKEMNKPAVAYAVAHTANTKYIDSSVPFIQETMEDCALNYGYSFIIRVDGEPEVVSAENLDIDEQYKSASKERLTRDAKSKASKLLDVLDQVTAKYPEVDYLEGLRYAASSVQSLDESYTSRIIISCGSGLGTTGYMNCLNNLLSAEPEVIVNMLKEREALPDLNGIIVYWFGMGQVDDPQQKLTPKQTAKLESIWQAVIEASGGKLISKDYITVEKEEKDTGALPSVSVVDVPEDTPITFDSASLDAKKNGSAFEEPVVLEESQVEFISDESNYLYPDKAIETLRPIAEYLTENQSINLLLIGSTAGDVTDEKTLKLSSDRAFAVKNTLVELGVADDRITTIGMGCDDPWHIKDAGYEGPAASSNRKVVLLDASTDQAQEIMSNK